MRLGPVAAIALLSLLPSTLAQAPEPEEIVLLVCATASGLATPAPPLPVCPPQDPAGPAPAGQAAPPAPAADPAAPEAALDLAGAALAAAQGIPADPAGAPDKLLALVATVLQFLKDLLALPVDAAAAIGASLVDAGEAVKGAGAAVADVTSSLAGKVGALLDSLRPQAGEPALPTAPLARAPRADVALELPLGELRQVLPER